MARITMSDLMEVMQKGFNEVKTEVNSLNERVTALESKSVTKVTEKKKPTISRRGDAQPKAEMVNFTKANGEVVQCTQAQANAWAKWRDGAAARVASKEAKLAKFEADRKAYKPSKALVDAIKANRAAVTRKVAKEQYGFVGTKDDLKALKDNICK